MERRKPLKRSKALSADPEKQKAWARRSRLKGRTRAAARPREANTPPQPPAPQPPPSGCWLAQFSPGTECAGRLIRAHLISRQQLRKIGRADLIHDPATWVWACGGATGIGGHHGMLDYARTLRVPRDRIPTDTEALAAQLGLTWWLDREYGR